MLGEFGRLVRRVDETALPPFDETPPKAYTRGLLLWFVPLTRLRAGAAPEPGDDLDDPWGRGETFFTRTADQIADVRRGSWSTRCCPRP